MRVSEGEQRVRNQLRGSYLSKNLAATFFVVQENNNSKKLKCLSPFTQLSRGHFLERPCLQSVGVLPRHHLSLMNVFFFHVY